MVSGCAEHFAAVKNHNIPETLIAAQFAKAKEFFMLPTEDKAVIKVNKYYRSAPRTNSRSPLPMPRLRLIKYKQLFSFAAGAGHRQMTRCSLSLVIRRLLIPKKAFTLGSDPSYFCSSSCDVCVGLLSPWQMLGRL